MNKDKKKNKSKNLHISDIIERLLSDNEINKHSIEWGKLRWEDDETNYKESKFDHKTGMLIAKRILLNAL